ncbi:predicted protein [Plenodomus lingam JN3]|uniref:Predicted protein n=1 Tax=Leptosphaeria maculans (strain JN3 / isolate v23.1.3 / race Av1-4-5-6-7-8) TaxID=985895 RepID=E4ZJ36_LEPMJ|nr:predicted protein [Plenodomus lingam JN3]CBX91467.1 predicted protein [Plenodomus lingam JN3]
MYRVDYCDRTFEPVRSLSTRFVHPLPASPNPAYFEAAVPYKKIYILLRTISRCQIEKLTSLRLMIKRWRALVGRCCLVAGLLLLRHATQEVYCHTCACFPETSCFWRRWIVRNRCRLTKFLQFLPRQLAAILVIDQHRTGFDLLVEDDGMKYASRLEGALYETSVHWFQMRRRSPCFLEDNEHGHYKGKSL